MYWVLIRQGCISTTDKPWRGPVSTLELATGRPILSEVWIFSCNYSFYHSTLFVLGSALSWAILARHLTSSTPLKCLMAVGKTSSELSYLLSNYFAGISMGMLKFSYSALNHIDGRLGKRGHTHTNHVSNFFLQVKPLDENEAAAELFVVYFFWLFLVTCQSINSFYYLTSGIFFLLTIYAEHIYLRIVLFSLV